MRRSFVKAVHRFLLPAARSLLALSMLAFTAGPSEAGEVCRLAYAAKVHYAPQIIALEKGWFEGGDMPVRAVNLGMSAGIAATEALVSGSADVAVMGDVPALYALASARACVVVASYGGGESMHALVVSGRSGIEKPEDLAGRRIGVHFGSSTHGAVIRYLEEHGLRSSVQLVNVKQSTLADALASGSIDALAASEPAPSLALRKVEGASRLTALGGLGNDYPLMMLASRKFAQEHPDCLERICSGVRRAVDFMQTEPAEAAAILSRATGVPAELEQDCLSRLDWGVRLDEGVVRSLEQTAEFLHGAGRLKKIPDIRSALWKGLEK